MREEEIRDAILKSIKVSVEKTWDTTGNDNSRQNSEKPNKNGSLYPLRLEEFSVEVSFKLPEDKHDETYRYGLSESEKSLGFTLRRRTLITQEEKKLLDELTERKKKVSRAYFAERAVLNKMKEQNNP